MGSTIIVSLSTWGLFDNWIIELYKSFLNVYVLSLTSLYSINGKNKHKVWLESRPLLHTAEWSAALGSIQPTEITLVLLRDLAVKLSSCGFRPNQVKKNSGYLTFLIWLLSFFSDLTLSCYQSMVHFQFHHCSSSGVAEAYLWWDQALFDDECGFTQGDITKSEWKIKHFKV